MRLEEDLAAGAGRFAEGAVGIGESEVGPGAHLVQDDHRHPVDVEMSAIAARIEPADGPGRG